MKLYLQMIKTVYDNRRVGDGYVPTHYVARGVGTSITYVTNTLSDLARRGIVKKARASHACLWKITAGGVRYLHIKEVIPREEMEQVVAEIERTSWAVD